MSGKDTGKRMTLEEIIAAYPHQNVGLIDCIPNSINFDTAIVKYTDREKTYSELVRMASNGEIFLMYTTVDEDNSGETFT